MFMNQEQYYFQASRINEATESFMTFWQTLYRSEMLISYLEVSSELIRKNENEARDKLTHIYYGLNHNPEYSRKNFESNLDVFLDLKFYETHLSSMVYTQTIDNLTTYFKDILSEIVKVRPQILKSKDTEKLDFILDYRNMDDLIEAISNKKIEELFYKGIEDIEKYFKDRLNIEIFKSENIKDNFNQLIKMRNLSVHNRGKVSKEFSIQFSEFKGKEGQYLQYDFPYVSGINLNMFNYLAELDDEISEKFKLKRVKIGD